MSAFQLSVFQNAPANHFGGQHTADPCRWLGHLNPTLSEAVKEAALNVEKRALHIVNR